MLLLLWNWNKYFSWLVSFAVTLCNFCLTVRQIIYITPKGRAHQCKSWVMVKKALISGWCKFSFYIILLNRHYFRSYCYKSKILYEWHKLGQDMYFKKMWKHFFHEFALKIFLFLVRVQFQLPQFISESL